MDAGAPTAVRLAPSKPAAASAGARIERLPFTPFHARALSLIGLAHFFDAFDALAIAFVLPVLIVAWKMDAGQAGMVVAVGFLGQAVGSIALGWAAERWGRLRVVAAACGIMSLFSLASAFAASVATFTVLRFVQGIGLGGEVPAGATYINEICPARLRGRMVYAVQIFFGAATACTAAVAAWMVPRYGWQSMYIAGGLPLLLAPMLRRLLPESPRWLASHGQAAEAARILDGIESEYEAKRGKTLPAFAIGGAGGAGDGGGEGQPAGFAALLAPALISRTLSVWLIVFCLSFSVYGILVWMPTVYTTVFKLPVQQALTYGAMGNGMALIGGVSGAFLIDRVSRRKMFSIALLSGALPLLLLSWFASQVSAWQVALLSTASFGCLAVLLPAVYVYAPEIYPTRMRGLGAGCALAWMRVAAIIGPIVIGQLLKNVGMSAAFLLIGVMPMLGALTVLLFGIETQGKALDDMEELPVGGSAIPSARAAATSSVV